MEKCQKDSQNDMQSRLIPWGELISGVQLTSERGDIEVPGPTETLGPMYGVCDRPCHRFTGGAQTDSERHWLGGTRTPTP